VHVNINDHSFDIKLQNLTHTTAVLASVVVGVLVLVEVDGFIIQGKGA
jgi:hypothetical protein